MDDLEQIAALALVRAIDRYDLDREVALSTFVTPTVIGELRRHFRDRVWAVHVPALRARSRDPARPGLHRPDDTAAPGADRRRAGRRGGLPARSSSSRRWAPWRAASGAAAGGGRTRRHEPAGRDRRGLRRRRRPTDARARPSRRSTPGSAGWSSCGSSRTSRSRRSPPARPVADARVAAAAAGADATRGPAAPRGARLLKPVSEGGADLRDADPALQALGDAALVHDDDRRQLLHAEPPASSGWSSTSTSRRRKVSWLRRDCSTWSRKAWTRRDGPDRARREVDQRRPRILVFTHAWHGQGFPRRRGPNSRRPRLSSSGGGKTRP